MPRRNNRTTGTDLALIEPEEIILQTITPAQQRFVEALLQGKNIGEASTIANVTRRTGTRWLAEGEPVAIEYEKQRVIALEAFRERVGSIYASALHVLEDCLAETAPLPMRFAAARYLLASNPRYLHYNVWLHDADELLEDQRQRERDKASKQRGDALDDMLASMMPRS